MFLHGYLSSKESFAFQTEALSKGFKTIAVDLPGFGKTPEPHYGFSLDDYVRFVLEVIARHAGGRADIVAHSFGGRIALKLAATHPEAVGKMLLTGCAGMKPKRSIAYRIKTLAYRACKVAFPTVAKGIARRIASPDYKALSPVMRESFKKIVNEHLEGVLPLVKAQSLLVFGSEDGETPLYMARRLNRGIIGSGLVVLEGCGHFCFCDNAVAFNAIAMEFFN